jgi:antirestriction protein ArdC
MNANNNVYQMVTDRIINLMQQGIIPWRKPWHFGAIEDGQEQAISYTTRRAYSLLNQWLLGEPGEYLTFNQIKERKGSIKKGEKARMVVFFKQMTYTEKDTETGEEVLKTYPLLRYYNVWHINQTEGIPSKCAAPEAEQPAAPAGPESIDAAEAVIAAYLTREIGLRFQNDKPSGSAYYSPSQDMVVVPMLSQYDCAAEYYSTAFHELTHSTLKASRCNRENDNAKSFFGNADYSREELVAEMGAAMLCSNCGIDSDRAFRNSVAYLQSWISALKNDNKMIVWAASRAEKAARYIIGGPEAIKPAEA